MIELFLIIAGIIGLWLSAELLIWASQAVSAKLQISDTFVGLTILSIGATLPELGTHIMSSISILKGVESSGIAIGSNVGSNIMQITVVMGIAAWFMKIHASEKFMSKDYWFMIGSIVLLFVFSLSGFITRFEGFLLALLYLVYLYGLGEKEHFMAKFVNKKKGIVLPGIIIAAGIALLLFTAKITVDNSIILSQTWGAEKSLVGALIVGVGNTLPELVTAIIAVRRKAVGMSLGVLVGSNISNPLLAVGVGAMISTYTIDSHIVWFDLPVWFFLSLLVWIVLKRKGDVTKKEAAILILSYIAYAIIRTKIGML